MTEPSPTSPAPARVPLFRWKAIIPMVLVLGTIVLLWVLLLDRTVRLLIVRQGTQALCARVELDRFHLSLSDLQVKLEGLRVADAASPMQDMLQLDEAAFQLEWPPLLEKKVAIREVAARGLRFGVPRTTSGAVPGCVQGPPGVASQIVNDWVKAVPRPKLDLGGLQQLRQLPSLRPDSLATVRQARAIIGLGDSLKRAMEAEVVAADPRPVIDTARALVERLKAFNPKALDVVGAQKLVQQAQATVRQVGEAKRRIESLQQGLTTRLDSLTRSVAALDQAKERDLAYARGLVRLPSLETPAVSRALFIDLAVQRLKPMLYYATLAEKYIPPGLDPRRTQGPKRLRAAGTTFTFPRERSYPTFLLRLGEASVEIGGASAATGAYRARVEGVTTEPALYGKPLRFLAERTNAAAGPRELRVLGAIDRTTRVPRDSLVAVVGGVSFPAVAVEAANASLDFGQSRVQVALARTGERIAGTWRIDAAGVQWTRTGAPVDAAAAAQLGTPAWAEALVWRIVSGIKAVSVEVGIGGTISRPELDIRSNVGDQLSAGLKQALGAEVGKLEAQLRAEVDKAVQEQVAAARQRLTVLDDAKAKLAAEGVQLDGVQQELEQRLKGLTGGIVPGLKLPKIPGLN